MTKPFNLFSICFCLPTILDETVSLVGSLYLQFTFFRVFGFRTFLVCHFVYFAVWFGTRTVKQPIFNWVWGTKIIWSDESLLNHGFPQRLLVSGFVRQKIICCLSRFSDSLTFNVFRPTSEIAETHQLKTLNLMGFLSFCSMKVSHITPVFGPAFENTFICTKRISKTSHSTPSLKILKKRWILIQNFYVLSICQGRSWCQEIDSLLKYV